MAFSTDIEMQIATNRFKACCGKVQALIPPTTDKGMMTVLLNNQAING